jgi:hypothetical protein
MEIKNSAYIDNGIPWFDGQIGQNYDMWMINENILTGTRI